MIGKVITNILTNDSTITGYVGTKIYPILMEEDTLLPAISYNVIELDSVYMKANWSHDVTHFEIRTYAKSYAECNSIATAVRNAFELKGGTYDTTIINAIYLEGYSEEYDLEGDSYNITLNFRTNVKQY